MKKAFEFVCGLTILFFMAVVFWQITPTEDSVQIIKEDPGVVLVQSDVTDFTYALQKVVLEEIGQPIEGYEPQMFMQVFPSLEQSDFNNVEAQIGVYKYRNGELKHEIPQDVMIHSAAPAITESGMETLLDNVTARLFEKSDPYTISDIVSRLKENSEETSSEPVDNPVACTMDAKMCPDGSFVGRVGPDCEFEACPVNTSPEVTTCSPDSRLAEMCAEIYAPVCGQVEVQCVTTPCEPVPETFSNACFACMNENVVGYTEGSCEVLEVY